MDADDLWSKFAANTADFDRELAALAVEPPSRGDERAAYLADLVHALSSSALPVREVDRRIRLIVRALSPTERELTTAIHRGHDITPAARNAIRSALPPNLRPLAVASIEPRMTAGPVAAAKLAAPPPDPPEIVDAGNDVPFHSVVLVGTKDEHSANVAMLNHEGFQPLRVSDLTTLGRVITSGSCGFVIAASAWQGLSEPQQREAVERLCSLSTFLFARLSLQGLAISVAASLPTVMQTASTASDRFCHGSSPDLTPADIAVLRSIRTLLDNAEGARFIPLGITANQAMLLRLIAGSRSSSGGVEVGRLGAREIAGGRSSARLYLLQGEQNRPFVVKLDTPVLLQDELRRYRTWISAWEQPLTNPTLHHHFGDAAIAYQLQGDADGINHPAPTLEDAIEGLRRFEWVRSDDPAHDPEAIARQIEAAVFRAAERLADLNKRAGSGENELWLGWPVRALAERGVQMAIEGSDLSTVTLRAVALLQARQSSGIVHGDIHGRNVLLIDRLPAFIDYAASGPGHPLIDLVRLDATVRHLAMRALVSESELKNVFTSVYVHGIAADKLLDAYPVFKASPACCLALRSAASIRQYALSVAQHFGGDIKELLAMVFVIAGYILSVRSPGSAIERAVLAAVGAEL